MLPASSWICRAVPARLTWHAATPLNYSGPELDSEAYWYTRAARCTGQLMRESHDRHCPKAVQNQIIDHGRLISA